MFSERIRNVLEKKRLLTAAPGTTVNTAAKRMARRKVGAILVVENDSLTGIFTERDALNRVIAKERDPRATRLSDVMTANPLTISPDEAFGYALLIMHEHSFRHLPVVEGGKLIGIVSARDALDPELEEFTSESRRREQLAKRRT